VTRPLSALAVLAILGALALASGIGAQQDPGRSSADGVYTRQQADEGRDLFALACQSCHAPTQHSGPPFLGKWHGRTLADLFTYLRREMPQTDPGTMTDTEYAALTAYILRINQMPTGRTPLAADSAALHRIRIDTLPSAPADTAGR
jgi:mono/diheme cytochrome c family protein